MQIFDQVESQVRSYCRSFPKVFSKAKGYKIWSVDGQEYIDFFAGAGALNYGHNHPTIQEKLVNYVCEDNIIHSLDMATTAKKQFLLRFKEVILDAKNLDYKIMFPGPTGTNAVESALKLARKVTGRDLVISFTNAFHGMTLGSLAVTGNLFKRAGAGIPLSGAVHMPYDGYLGDGTDTVAYLERFLQDGGSGVSLPAAIILETVQAEGGLNKASMGWLRGIEQLCRQWNILLIIDDIQVGCGRTGPFFSFEPAGILPDIVCLSKSISGFGLPMALTLLRPDLDQWAPGEHNGTFRGNNLAFVGATAALTYWENDRFSRQVQHRAELIEQRLRDLVKQYPDLQGEVRGRGMIQGIACPRPGLAESICSAAFERGLIMETSGANSEVVKILPPLIIDEAGLQAGLDILEESIATCLDARVKAASTTMAALAAEPSVAACGRP